MQVSKKKFVSKSQEKMLCVVIDIVNQHITSNPFQRQQCVFDCCGVLIASIVLCDKLVLFLAALFSLTGLQLLKCERSFNHV